MAGEKNPGTQSKDGPVINTYDDEVKQKEAEARAWIEKNQNTKTTQSQDKGEAEKAKEAQALEDKRRAAEIRLREAERDKEIGPRER
ncbi:MAG TPA: hypothetical protein VMF32_08815 [Xanthobacteraceae bacterium]|nr:hypothetical protein [Xanthobacteraceae bacterium]